MISILCHCYNHKDTISRCINSLVMQQVDFDYEIIIHDDASIDGSQEVIKQYKKLYPSLIRSIFQSENQYSRGIFPTSITFPHAKGDLIAYCEGDDYWVDPMKLQLQKAYLDRNPNRSFVGGQCQELFSNDRLGPRFPTGVEGGGIFLLPAANFFKMQEYVHTSTFLLRRELLLYRDEIFGQSLVSGDLAILLAASLRDGNVAVLNRVVSHYRIHASGTWTAMSRAGRMENYASAWKHISDALNSQAEDSFVRYASDNANYFCLLSEKSFAAKLRLFRSIGISSVLRVICRFSAKRIKGWMRWKSFLN